MCIYIYIHVYIHVYMYIHIYIYIYIHVCVYMHMCIRIHCIWLSRRLHGPVTWLLHTRRLTWHSFLSLSIYIYVCISCDMTPWYQTSWEDVYIWTEHILFIYIYVSPATWLFDIRRLGKMYIYRQNTFYLYIYMYLLRHDSLISDVLGRCIYIDRTHSIYIYIYVSPATWLLDIRSLGKMYIYRQNTFYLYIYMYLLRHDSLISDVLERCTYIDRTHSTYIDSQSNLGWHFRKLKAQSSNVSFASSQWKETFELWALSFETAFENVTPSGIGCTCIIHKTCVCKHTSTRLLHKGVRRVTSRSHVDVCKHTFLSLMLDV